MHDSYFVTAECQPFIVHAKVRKGAKIIHALPYDGFCFACGLFAKLRIHIANLMRHVIEGLTQPPILISHIFHEFVRILLRHQCM